MTDLAVLDGPATMAQVVAHRAAESPDAVAVQVAGVPATYGHLRDAGNRVASALHALGVGPGDRVALLCANSLPFLEVWVGLTAGGVVEVPLNVSLRGDLLADQLHRSGSRVVVVDAPLADRVAAVRDRVPDLAHVVVVGAPSGTDGQTAHGTPDALSYRELVAGAAADPPALPVDPRSPSSIMFTSGTTGPSKGVVRSHVADLMLARTTVEAMGYGPGEVLFSAFPLYHLNARFNSVLAAMLCGGRLVLHDRFSASRFWDTCREEGVTAFNFMGALLTMLLAQEPRPDDRDHQVRCAYGAPAPERLLRPFEDRFGVTLVEVYGSTELGIATMNTVADRRVGTSGRAAPYVEVAIHDDDDVPVPAGTPGEIVARPTVPGAIFDRYHDMPEETLAAIRNLWFHTGDRGWLDEAGDLHFLDRIKDAVRRRGENISSFEVEAVIAAFPDVAACAVVGVPDEVSGEEVAAWVVGRPGREVDPVALLDHCQERLPHFAVPRYVVAVADLPLTPSQRVEKYRLRAEGLPDGAWDREAHGYEVHR